MDLREDLRSKFENINAAMENYSILKEVWVRVKPKVEYQIEYLDESDLVWAKWPVLFLWADRHSDKLQALEYRLAAMKQRTKRENFNKVLKDLEEPRKSYRDALAAMFEIWIIGGCLIKVPQDCVELYPLVDKNSNIKCDCRVKVDDLWVYVEATVITKSLENERIFDKHTGMGQKVWVETRDPYQDMNRVIQKICEKSCPKLNVIKSQFSKTNPNLLLLSLEEYSDLHICLQWVKDYIFSEDKMREFFCSQAELNCKGFTEDKLQQLLNSINRISAIFVFSRFELKEEWLNPHPKYVLDASTISYLRKVFTED